MWKRTFLVWVVVTLAACGRRDPSETPEITSEARNGSTKLVFKIGSNELREDGSQRLSAVGLLQSRPVGFDLEFRRWFENGPGFVNAKSYQCTTQLVSQGAPSDELLKFMDGLYGTHSSTGRMAEAIELQAISIFKDPAHFEKGAVKLILSIQPGWDENDHCEMFVEVDKEEGRIYLTEKHARYRRALIAALNEPPIEEADADR